MRDMAIVVDFDSSIPLYQQIADQIRSLVAQGQLADWAELPSVRHLGAKVGVNQNTVARAYRILADEGLVQLRHGAGARVRVPQVAGPALQPQEILRSLHDIISRLVLAGAGRGEVEGVLAEAVQRFFDPKE